MPAGVMAVTLKQFFPITVSSVIWGKTCVPRFALLGIRLKEKVERGFIAFSEMPV
jgi:hypothetical protein